MSVAHYLDQFLDPMTAVLTPEVAQAIVELRADAETEARIEELREKANAGTLTSAEEADYKEFVEAVDIISIIQAKARKVLVNRSA